MSSGSRGSGLQDGNLVDIECLLACLTGWLTVIRSVCGYYKVNRTRRGRMGAHRTRSSDGYAASLLTDCGAEKSTECRQIKLS